MELVASQPFIPRPAEQRIPTVRNILKAAFLLGLFGLTLAITQTLLGWLGVPGEAMPPLSRAIPAGIIILVSAVVTALLISAQGAIAHEGIHKVLSRNRFVNDLVGGFLSALVVFLPFYANRKWHLDHHGDTHEPGIDPEEALHRHNFWVAFLFGGAFAIWEHYKIVFAFLTDRGPRRRTRVAEGLKDLGFVAAALAFYFALLPALGVNVMLTVVPMFSIGGLIYSFRAICDHFGVPSLSESNEYLREKCPALVRDSRFRVVDSWVILTNPFLNWLWSHLNYQQVHHRYPFLSHVYLPEIYEATKEYQPYLVAHGYLDCMRTIRNRGYYTTPDDMARHFQFPVHAEPIGLKLNMAGELEPGTTGPA
jgi:fatty acid desaturase